MSVKMKLAARKRFNDARIAKGLPPKEYPPISQYVANEIAKKIESQSYDWMNKYKNGLYRLTICQRFFHVECTFTRNAVSFVCPFTNKLCTLTIASFRIYEPSYTVIEQQVGSSSDP